MGASLIKRAFVYLLLCLFVITTTAQQSVGIVSTVANLVGIVQGANSSPAQQGQPIVEGAVYRSDTASAAEFSFPEGLRAAAGPSSSVAFHPSPAGVGTRLVALSEGVYRFTFPDRGSRLDIATPAGALRLVSAAPGSEVVARVGPGQSVEITATRGRVELRDWATGALLLLLLDGHSATFGSGAAHGLALSGESAANPQALNDLARMNDILAGKVAPPPSPSNQPPAPPEAPSGGGFDWGGIAIAVGTFIAVTVLTIVAAHSGGGGGNDNNNDDTPQ